jgi:methionyl-tRNA formyltransferase
MATRIVFMGSPAFAVPALEALIAAEYEVVAVYTQPDRPAGRGLALSESPVKRAALAHGLTVQTPETLRGEKAAAWLALLRPDAVVVAAYAKLLPEAVLSIPEYGCINIHPSLLPCHRGASPVPAAILAGDDFTGVSIMLMEKGLDTGPVLAQTWVPVRATDTTGSLTEKLALVAARQLTTTLPRWFRGEIVPCVQADELATYSSTITRKSGNIDWSLPAIAIDRAVRAYNPWPTAYTRWRGKELKIHAAVPLPEEGNCPAGTVVALGSADIPVGVATGRGILGLKEIQLEAKKRVPAAEFIRGAREFMGSVLTG